MLRSARIVAPLFVAAMLAVPSRGDDGITLAPGETLLFDAPVEEATVPTPLGAVVQEAADRPPAAAPAPSEEAVSADAPPAVVDEGFVPPAVARCADCRGHCRTTSYAHFDVLFLQRDNQSTDQLLAAVEGQAVITTGQLQFPTQPAVRLLAGRADADGGWEAGYLGVWGMFAARTAGGVDNLQAADPLAFLVRDFNDRGLARATYASTLNSAEANLFTRFDDGGFCRQAAEPWRRCDGYRRGTFDWLAGFRWAGLEEAADLTLSGGAFPAPSSYALRSTTNLFGAQVGGRGRMEWERWAIEGWAKAALCGSALQQSQAPIVEAVPAPPIRPAQSSAEGGVGFIGDINATLVYRLSDSWGLRAGYNLIWLSGVALAPNQFDFGAATTSGSGLNGGAGLFLHGASLGLEARW